MKEFELHGKQYCFDFDNAAERKVKLFQEFSANDLYGNQKSVIVEKLFEIIQSAPDIKIKDEVKQYIKDYHSGKNKDASHTTNSLGKILNDFFEGKLQ